MIMFIELRGMMAYGWYYTENNKCDYEMGRF